ncbi:MAG TPA: inositol monophosphatase family protein [Candidatus Limnocylindrales bacterium]
MGHCPTRSGSPSRLAEGVRASSCRADPPPPRRSPLDSTREKEGSSGPGFGARWSAGRRLGSEGELEEWLGLAMELADLADKMAMAAFRRDVAVSQKPDRSLVTDIDQAIERIVRERITAAYPGHGVVGEEYGMSGPAASVRWFVDPIDGTHNFIRGIPLFGILIGIERDGELQVGVCSAPALGERWHARRGGGAWARSTHALDSRPRRIRVSKVRSIGDAQVLYGSAQDIAASGRAPGFGALVRAAWRDRGFGDFWGYALVAEGAAEAMIEADLKPWDLAAPTVVVEEAGGRVTDLDGVRTIAGGSVLASNGLLHDELLHIVAGS